MTTDTACGEPPAGGCRPEYFEQLAAALEAGNFWFRARNELICWAKACYFPHAESLFEVGCGTGYVLAGLAQANPGLRLIGSELFAEGLSFAAGRVPAA